MRLTRGSSASFDRHLARDADCGRQAVVGTLTGHDEITFGPVLAEEGEDFIVAFLLGVEPRDVGFIVDQIAETLRPCVCLTL